MTPAAREARERVQLKHKGAWCGHHWTPTEPKPYAIWMADWSLDSEWPRMLIGQGDTEDAAWLDAAAGLEGRG